jgi:two-component system sensor histidine kinase ChvG
VATTAIPTLRAHSLVRRLVLLAGAFIAVPLVLYITLRDVYSERQALLLEGVREQGRLVATALTPLLQQEDVSALPKVADELDRFGGTETRLKILFRKSGEAGASSFYFVAAAPPVDANQLDDERQTLLKQGILSAVAATCNDRVALADRYVAPDGSEELLTSITPVLSPPGCWAIVMSHPIDSIIGAQLGRPYWTRPEVQIAGAIYILLAALTFGVFLSIRRSVVRFRDLAQEIRVDGKDGASFAERNEVAELGGVAREFDRMIGRLRASARHLRQTAQDNAHAFKTPIAIMRQAIVPLRRLATTGDDRVNRALQILESSVDRLDSLVAASRRMDETMAELVDPPRERVHLSALVGRIAAGYRPLIEGRRIALYADIEAGLMALGGEELMETIVENILDNAVGFSPESGRIDMSLKRNGARVILKVSDQGPGVPEGDHERIFERQYSQRPTEGAGSDDHRWHSGLGLWIVRRNVEAMGGDVKALNGPKGGLILSVSLPVAR